jgi:hypothetical protein
MEANCPICAKKAAPAAPERAPRVPRQRSGAPARPSRSAATAMRVRRMERAPDDGYDSALALGLHSSVDAARLADELAFAEARLAELREDPPGLYADVALAADRDEAAWLAFQIAVIAPARGDLDPWAPLEGRRTTWASGEVPDDHADVLAAYRGWTERHGGQITALTGEAEWDPVRRFGRTFERLAVRGLERSPRFDFLVTLGALGVVPLEAGSLALSSSKPTDPVVLAAKRVTGIGDALTIERRLAELARGTGVAIGALDLALYNWAQPTEERSIMGARRGAAPERLAQIRVALGLVAE